MYIYIHIYILYICTYLAWQWKVCFQPWAKARSFTCRPGRWGEQLDVPGTSAAGGFQGFRTIGQGGTEPVPGTFQALNGRCCFWAVGEDWSNSKMIWILYSRWNIISEWWLVDVSWWLIVGPQHICHCLPWFL